MNKETIYKTIKRRHPDEDLGTVQAITADVYYSGIAEELLAGKLDTMFARYKSRVGAADLKVQADDPETCPICKDRLMPIKLDSEVTAVFCPKHFVVYPDKNSKAK